MKWVGFKCENFGSCVFDLHRHAYELVVLLSQNFGVFVKLKNNWVELIEYAI